MFLDIIYYPQINNNTMFTANKEFYQVSKQQVQQVQFLNATFQIIFCMQFS